ncbi:MAG TPA: glycosyltransferase family protein [Longimicrobiales bacterium]|nr:glycosyltransferase family protein [Longimicrobiales bacterium]
MSRLAVSLLVQGEGRGHMTQALATARYLRDAGHEIERVLVGRSPFRSLPDYFVREIAAPVETFDAPTQVPDREGRGLSLSASAADAVRRLPRFLLAGRRIHHATRRADVVVNFFDLVGGISRVLFRTLAPVVSVAHNYIFLHPALAHAPRRPHAHTLVMGYARATALRSASRLALSFDPLPNATDARLVVTPPLLRHGLGERTPRDDGYLLAYALNPGYGDMLADWHRRNSDATVHCYLDGGAAALADVPIRGFHAHALDQDGFLGHLEGCRAYLGTAGFESVCEAFHLAKPALVVPTAGQYEQALNAWDAERVGAARSGGYEALDTFWRDPPAPSPERVEAFRSWVSRAPEIVVREVERAAAGAG